MTNSYTHLHQTIREWYKTHGRRDLPWRNTANAYHIYLSEIMLQQTQVKTVLGRFYFPFLERFPTLNVLGNADLQQVLKMWEGLGYYTRARNLHKTAQLTRGTLPDSIEALVALPGIGKNTAHAIAAFAFGKAVPVMEANLKRVLCRFFALETVNEKQLWIKAYELLDHDHAFDYNQAMMDIGALICKAKNPQCDACPLYNMCQGKSHPHRYPAKTAKKTASLRQRHILIWRNDADCIYLTQRKGRFLHGMYCFDERNTAPQEVPHLTTKIGRIRHTYSHFTLDATVYIVDAPHPPQNGKWYNITEVDKLPLSGADRKALTLLGNITHTTCQPQHSAPQA